MTKLGAHQSIAGGICNALKSVHSIGGECLQIFSSSPRTWQNAAISSDDISRFQEDKKEKGIEPIVFHACYLINLADKGFIGRKSIENLTHELQLATKLGVIGSIVHTGSFKTKENGIYNFKNVPKEDYKILLNNIGEVLEPAPKDIALILENSGTHKIGTIIEELGQIIADLKDERVKVCLDTCHLHSSGYDLTTEEKLDVFLEDFNKRIGLAKLAIFHLNDSKDKIGSYRDRHENIGKGEVGVDVFKNILNNKTLKDKPFIIETPGFDGNGPDKENIDILKSYIK